MVAIEHRGQSSTITATTLTATAPSASNNNNGNHNTQYTATNTNNNTIVSPTTSASSQASSIGSSATTTTTSSVPPPQPQEKPKNMSQKNAASGDDQQAQAATNHKSPTNRQDMAKSAVSQRNVDIKIAKKSQTEASKQELTKKMLKLDLSGKQLDESLKSPKSPITARLPHQASLTSSVDVEDRKTLREALYQGIFHRHRRTIFAVGSFLRMLRSRNSQYNSIRSSSEVDVDVNNVDTVAATGATTTNTIDVPTPTEEERALQQPQPQQAMSGILGDQDAEDGARAVEELQVVIEPAYSKVS